MQTAYIGLGSNIAGPAGPPDATLTAAALRLGSLGRVTARSSLYSTEPVGFTEQPRFLNAVVALETNLDPRVLLAGLLSIEREFGRDRSSGQRNGPRTLDLDLLMYGTERLDEPGLQLPHPRLAERGFVLIPLAEIASDVVHALDQAPVKQLLYDWQISNPHPLDAVIPFQSDLWRPGAGGASHSTGDAARSESRAAAGSTNSDR